MKPMITAVLTAVLSIAASAADSQQMRDMFLIQQETEQKIQKSIVDPILGRGRAFVFARLDLRIKEDSKSTSSSGAGKTVDEKGKAGDEGGKKTQSRSAETLKFERGSDAKIVLEAAGFKLRLVHDDQLTEEEIASVRKALLAVYAEDLDGKDIVFIPAPWRGRGG